MNTIQTNAGKNGTAAIRAYSLVEVMVAIAVLGVMFVSLYAGLSSGVQIIQVARENLRATQIMLEKMESIRLASWEQVTSGTNFPPTFVDLYYPLATNASDSGLTYYGQLIITNADTGANYDADMRLVIVTVTWTNFNVPRTREMRTYVARNGMQNYIF